MKLFKIIILAAFLVSSLPLGAFCQDAHQDATAGHGHCVTMCSVACSHATVPDQEVISVFVAPVAATLAVIDFAYQNPSLDTLKRPPVFSA